TSDGRAASLLERKAQIADLAKEEAAFTKQRESVCAKRDEVKAALETASRLQREFGEVERKIDNLRSEKNALERQVAAADELVELVTVRRADIEMYEQKLTAQGQESRESEDLIKNHSAEREKAETNAVKIAEQRATRIAAISDREAELRTLRNSLGELQDRRSQQQVRESQLQMKIDNLAEHVSR